jgi:hypothetical protein
MNDFSVGQTVCLKSDNKQEGQVRFTIEKIDGESVTLVYILKGSFQKAETSVFAIEACEPPQQTIIYLPKKGSLE